MRLAIDSGEGFIKVVGEVGTGKTMLCRMLLSSLRDDEHAVYIPNPMLTPVMLRLAVARELGLEGLEPDNDHSMIARIQERLLELAARRVGVVVCLDEAQAMPDESLEALRLLTNLETEKRKLLQVVMFGQPELDTKLDKPDLRQIRQRIAWSFGLQALGQLDVAAYVDHRLACAGYRGEPLFRPAALSALTRASQGIPRVVNMVAHKSLLLAYGRGDGFVDERDVSDASRDTEGAVTLQTARISWALVAVAVGALLLGSWTLWQGGI